MNKKVNKQADKQASAEDSVEVILEYFIDALENLDFEALANLLHEDCVYKNVPFHTAKGKNNVLRDLKAMAKRINFFNVEMISLAVNKNTVLTERIDTLGGKFFKAEIELMGVFVIRDGLIIEWRDYFDWSTAGGRFLKGMFSKVFSS
jgi:limonene-1,2-epoxide hydrolase